MNPKGQYVSSQRHGTPQVRCKTRKPVRTEGVLPSLEGRELSDSEESVKTTASDDSTSGGTASSSDCQQGLSLVAEFDDLLRLIKQQRCDEVEDKFLEFVLQTKLLNGQWKTSTMECLRLQAELEKKISDIHDLDRRLATARKLLDQERKRTSKIEEERDILEIKISRAIDLLFNNKQSQLPDETRQQLAFLNNMTSECNAVRSTTVPQLSTIQETNTTGSLLSDFSCSMSEDGLDISLIQSKKTWKTHRPSLEGATEEPERKKRRSGSTKFVEIDNNDKVRATTTLTVSKDGPITATSIIESIPPKQSIPPKTSAREVFLDLNPSAPPEHLVRDVWQMDSPRTTTKSNNRQHNFQSKAIVVPEGCVGCGKRIRFAKTAYKCKDCRAVCHPECKANVPLPCIPLMNTPTQRGILGVIADYTPTYPPMVPALIVHCTNEIEAKGLREIGLYRIPGSEKEVKMLKEKFLKGKSSPCLHQVDVHVLCGTVKDFLRSLHEPLLTYSRWHDCVHLVETKDKADIPPALFQIITELPQPNRDTLAHMILHLKRIAIMPECKMPIKNLSRIFAPTIVGYSSNNPPTAILLNETRQQGLVMEHLMNLPDSYWELFINYNDNTTTPLRGLQQTPSTDSLLRPQSKDAFSTPRGLNTLKRKERYFVYPGM